MKDPRSISAFVSWLWQAPWRALEPLKRCFRILQRIVHETQAVLTRCTLGQHYYGSPSEISANTAVTRMARRPTTQCSARSTIPPKAAGNRESTFKLCHPTRGMIHHNVQGYPRYPKFGIFNKSPNISRGRASRSPKHRKGQNNELRRCGVSRFWSLCFALRMRRCLACESMRSRIRSTCRDCASPDVPKVEG